MASKQNQARTSDILMRRFQGESFREIYCSYPDISYARLVDIAAQARHRARIWIDEKERSTCVVADHFGISSECLDNMLRQARDKKERMNAQQEAYDAKRELEQREHFDLMMDDASDQGIGFEMPEAAQVTLETFRQVFDAGFRAGFEAASATSSEGGL
jgi:uncharacterized tellurite resistance protein B-like protein